MVASNRLHASSEALSFSGSWVSSAAEGALLSVQGLGAWVSTQVPSRPISLTGFTGIQRSPTVRGTRTDLRAALSWLTRDAGRPGDFFVNGLGNAAPPREATLRSAGLV